MVKSKTERNVDSKIKRLGLSRFIGSSRGVREMSLREKQLIIRKTSLWNKSFKKEGKRIGPKTILFRGKKYTNHGVLI